MVNETGAAQDLVDQRGLPGSLVWRIGVGQFTGLHGLATKFGQPEVYSVSLDALLMGGHSLVHF